MTTLAAFIGSWELLLIAAVLDVLAGLALAAGLKGRHSSAQGKALGSSWSWNQALKGRHNPQHVSPFQGLRHFESCYPGLCPGLTNHAPLGLNFTLPFLATVHSFFPFHFTTHPNPQEAL